MNHLPLLAAAAIACTTIPASTAQVVHAPLNYFFPEALNGSFGHAVSGAGDVNNDGFDDIIVGAYDGLGSANRGTAYVYCGKTGTRLFHFTGSGAGDYFGWSVSAAGDVNNDGFDDFMVGAPNALGADTNSGQVTVYSGATGTMLYTFIGWIEARLGSSVSGAGDVNNDGFDDVIMGGSGAVNNGPFSGIAHVQSGATGSNLYSFTGDSPNDYFGTSVSGAGDVNNDGFDDLIVGASRDGNNVPDSGSAKVFSGATGAILYTFNGDSSGDRFGRSVSGAGDVNNDGHHDLIVGAPWNSSNGLDSGYARVYSGATGAILYAFSGDSEFDRVGHSVSGAGDVNNDGFDDFIVGSPGEGKVRVYSGDTGSILYTFTTDWIGDLFGNSVSDAGDINNDGYADFIIGAPNTDFLAPSSARVYLSVPLPIPTPCPGDADLSGTVNFSDITAVLSTFNSTCP